MLRALTTLLVFQLLGEIVTYSSHAPIPGPVFGMVFLFVYLKTVPAEVERLKGVAQELLRHLSLLFVPAGVGVMMYIETVAREWLPLLVSLLVSTALTLVVTALSIRLTNAWMTRKLPKDEGP